jgi:succinyl-CoA synthetase beta subunit
MSLIIIDQVFIDEKFSKTILTKTTDCEIVPSIGMEIEDSAWEKPKKIKKININPEHNCYKLFVEDEFITKRDSIKITDIYKKCGWKISDSEAK